jgi:hypothetical protein
VTFDPKAFKTSPPEVLGRVLQTVMYTFEVADYFTILEVLRSTDIAHKLKWIIRNVQTIVDVGHEPSEPEKANALNVGLRRLREHGEREAGVEVRKSYLKDLEDILEGKGIK